MLRSKREVRGFRTLVQKIRNYFTNYNFITRWFGKYGSLWYFLGIQTFFFDCMPSSFPKQGWRLSRFRFVPETFLRFQWRKDIWVDPSTGFHIDDKSVHRWKHEKERVSEHREFFLYSPWIIDSWYNHSAPDQRVVVEIDGFEEIETHSFDGCVQRRKLPWWNTYRVRNRWTNDVTEFDRAVDRHVGGDYE
jgi:hypothetical protein|tara:strand:- start:1088 stop:1660 length:573 start_codon:yes stop_codon:yes gene_type:complete